MKGLKKLAKRQQLSKFVFIKLIDRPNHHIRMVMAGGDGSLMTLVMMAKEAGCDIATLVCCVLPYGTGNDLARVLNWGGSEGDLKIYSSLP